MSLLSPLWRRTERRVSWDDWDTPWHPQAVNLSGASIDEVSAFNFSAVWACQTLIADAIATMPVDTFRREEDRRVPTSAPSWLATPNGETGRVEFDTQRVLSLLGWGNSYTWLKTDSGRIVERWPLDPSQMRVERRAGELAYFYKGDRLPSEQVQHVKGYSLPGSYTGMSVISHAAQSIGMSVAAEQFGAQFFSQGAVASGLLEAPQMPTELNKAMREQIREDFAARHAGIKNAHKPMLLTGGVTWKPTMVNPDDAQLLESRKFQVTEVARWFRVPPHLIGDVERSTSWGTGIEQQGIGFVQYTLAPWIIRLEEADSKLLARPRFVKYNVNALIRADLSGRFTAYNQARTGGWLSVNEIRALEDMPPIDNGDVFLEPVNMAEAGTDAEPPVAEAAADPTPLNVAVNFSDGALRVEPHITAEPAQVTVERTEISVEPTNITVEPTTVNVESPHVNVDMPEPRRPVSRTVERDEDGNIVAVVESDGVLSVRKTVVRDDDGHIARIIEGDPQA